jgi:hypothetical protein
MLPATCGSKSHRGTSAQTLLIELLRDSGSRRTLWMLAGHASHARLLIRGIMLCKRGQDYT